MNRNQHQTNETESETAVYWNKSQKKEYTNYTMNIRKMLES